MAIFEYTGRDSRSNEVKGQLEASSADSAAGTLAGRGITPINITEYKARKSGALSLSILSQEQKVTSPDLIMFCRQMYTITKAGIPLIKGIRSLAASLKHYTLQRTLNDVADRLETGLELSVALRAHPTIFNHLFVSLVSVGENSGRLDLTFEQLADYLERDLQTARSIKQAVRYPTFVLVALSVALVVINIWVIPAFGGMFSRFGADLPLPTKILIGISNFFVNYWPFLLVAVVAALVGLWHYVKTDKGARHWGKLKLRLPVLGDVIERATMARYARSFSLMINAGMPLHTSLDLCARAIDNPYLADKVRTIRSGIERGEGLYQTHVMSGMFTPLVLQMINVGEESGQVDVLLAEVGEFYEREVDYDVKKLSDKIEPILIVVMAGFVLVLALGIFLPMWEMYNIQK
ncbi:type II secretion system F family protein [Gilvimarinus sp. SDUM040013]|uniref:Type II secretion system F family protein n=1 Tax=Gilvimarinus gilvus TaxID=3058038 RepID=A0ABU4RS49_9GAMM|nr:type II secretion system F family protein [Gilvimarinus sp. SDUM040013]MDO3388176.1 type II secretion system F family protein [Gilvimarinus sp. SDUM040013]MDX6847726.1 type II secretion system F family protein [Gilvimarinus sp. SDUM040013]